MRYLRATRPMALWVRWAAYLSLATMTHTADITAGLLRAGRAILHVFCFALLKKFSLPQIWCSVLEGHYDQDCACAEWILLWHIQQTHSGFHRHYTQTSAKFLILLKRLSSWMCFIISNDLYTAHHNSFKGICHQLKSVICNRTFDFLTQCICIRTESLF